MFRHLGQTSFTNGLRLSRVALLVTLGAAPAAHAQTLEPMLGVASDLMQDKEGFVWAAGPQGVVRFDGVEAAPVLEKHPALRAGAHRLFEDKSGHVWIATGSGDLGALDVDGLFHVGSRVGPAGLLRWDGERADVIVEASAATSHWVWAFAQDGHGDMWIGTEGGLLLVQGNKTKHISLGIDAASNFISGLWFDPKGRLWMGTAAGLKHFDPATQKAVSGPLNEAVHVLVAKGPADAALATDSAVWQFNGSTIVRVGTLDGIRSLAVDTERRIWAGGLQSPRRFDESNAAPFEILPDAHGISALLVDRDGGLWSAAIEGVSRARPDPFVRHMPGSFGSAMGVLASSDGTVWSPGSTAGLLRMTANGASVSIGNANQWGHFRSMAEAADHVVWFASPGFYRWSHDVLSPIEIKNVPASRIRRVAIAPDGAAWLATSDSILWRYDTASFDNTPKTFTADDGVCPNRVTFIHAAKSGRVWFGGRAGLTLIENNRARCFTTADGLPANDVTHALEDDDGTVWITTIGTSGLARFKDGHFEDVGTACGLPRGGMFGIVNDSHAKFWLSSARGVVSVAQSDLEATMRSGTRDVAFDVISTQQGLASDACALPGQPPLSLDGQGILWVPTSKGVSGIDTRRAAQPATARAAITYVDVDGSRVPKQSAIRMRPLPNRLEVGLGGPAFDFPNSSRLQVRLDGFDRTWQDPQTRRVAVYNDLPAGSYTFKVRMLRSANGKDAGSADASLIMIVAPQVHETLWFKLLAAATLLTLVAILLVHRRRRAKREREQIHAERVRIARELHDGLAQLFMGLGYQVDAMRAVAKDSPWQSKLEQLRGLVDSAGQQVHEAVWRLRPSVGDLALQQAFRKIAAQAKANLGLRVTLDLTNGLPSSGPCTYELPRILEEALTNAVKHGAARDVHVSVIADHELIVMCIDDDGTGAQVPAQARGFGLVGMRERAAQCGGILNAGARTDASGFRIEVRLPARTDQATKEFGDHNS